MARREACQTNVRRLAVDNSQGNPQDVPLTFHRPGSVRWSFVATVAPGGWMNGRVSGGGPGTDGGLRALEPTHRRRGVGGAGPAARTLETPESASALVAWASGEETRTGGMPAGSQALTPL